MGQKELQIEATGCFSELFVKTKEYLATDIDILEGHLPRLGRLKEYVPAPGLTESSRKDIEGLIDITLPPPENGDNSHPQKRVNIEYAFSIKNHGRYRVSATQSEQGIGLSIRKLPYFIPKLGDIDKHNFLKGLTRVFEGKDSLGLILHTGLTGAGKSTSIASEVDLIARNISGRILTFEAPIEYHYIGTKARIVQYEVGRDVPAYVDGMKLALRNDPTVVVIGEVRTHEEIRTMVDIAVHGQLVFATLHTSNVMNTLRFLDSIGEDKESWRQLLALSLRAIISHKLMYTVDHGFIFIPEILIPNNVVRQKIAAGKLDEIKELFHSSGTLREGGSTTFKNTLDILSREKIITDFHRTNMFPTEYSMV